MQGIRWMIGPSLSALAAAVLAVTAGEATAGPTRLHDPALDHVTLVHGVSNGQGTLRGPWVVQLAVAEDEFLYLTAIAEPAGGVTTLRAIAGNGRVYFGRNHSLGGADVCIQVPVTGWMTVHVDVAGASEQRFVFSYVRKTGCAVVDPPH
jgi:hypothetical protein